MSASSLGLEPQNRNRHKLIHARKYELLGEIGSGRFGTVFQGRRRADDERVVVKVTKGGSDWEEAYLQHVCRCEDVLEVLDTFGSPFYNAIVMPVATCSLAGHMRNTRTATTGLPTQEMLAVVLGTARGLTCIHQAGVLHQDIHTGNVFVRVLWGGGIEPLIGDFGRARALNNLSVTGEALVYALEFRPSSFAVRLDHRLMIVGTTPMVQRSQ